MHFVRSLLLSIVMMSGFICGHVAASALCRNATSWPFNVSSIWNIPIGMSAQYSPADLYSEADSKKGAFWQFDSDDDYFFDTRGAPTVDWYNQGHWGGDPTEEAYCNITGPLVTRLPFPANTTVQKWGNNNAAALLQEDGRTVLLMQPLYVCTEGAPILALAPPPSMASADIYTEGGALGGHGGSGLSALGGTVRMGELLPGAPPISHALKLELYANLFYYRPPSGNRSECYHYPAVACDGYMNDCETQPTECYNGTNPLLTPGSLLAIPLDRVEAVNASLRTAPAKALLYPLVYYGGYLVDDTAWNASALCTEHGVAAEFLDAYGYNFTTNANAKGDWGLFYQDMLTLFRALAIVSSNGPEAPGGGGAPLQAPAPPFCSPPPNA